MVVALGMAEFEYLQRFVREHSAIVIDGGKEAMAEMRLAPLAGQEGLPSAQHLLERLRTEAFNGLHRKVLDAMTNNETSFFRDLTPFEVLRNEILPEVITRRANLRRLSIWSAACSTGQEAYSVAMMVREHFPELRNWSLFIQGTDISTAALEYAKRGRYTQLEVNRGLPVRYLAKYFSAHGMDWQIHDELRELVEFCPINLAKSWAPLPLFDVVLLRNLLIYFEPETRQHVLRSVPEVLHPEGYLLLGGPESVSNLGLEFETVIAKNVTYYRLRRNKAQAAGSGDRCLEERAEAIAGTRIERGVE
jgi:chemotaxis protein methyltransferase CheR